MKITSYFLGLLICMLAFNGCQEEQLYSEKGSFTVMLEDDLTDIITTKSTPTELGKPLTSLFQLEIRNINTEEIAYNGLCDKTYYEVNTGTYDLTATYGSNEELAFDAPYYKGELKSQKIEASGKSVTIPCSIANSLVSVKYTNENVFNTLFSSYGITVTCNDKSLVWSSEKAQQSVYFKAGSSVSFVFKGILKEGNKEVSFPITEGLPKTFAAKDHYILKLTYQAGQSSLSITTEYKSSSINETVPQSWLPAPQLESTDFSSTKVLSSVETEKKSAIIQMKIARPLQDMQIEFDFQDTQFTSLNKTYLLSELSNDEATALENAGIILPKIGDSAPVINLTELTEKLQTINGGTTTVNNVYIKAKANDRWSHDEASRGDHYNINIQRPTFTVSVQEGNVWSKEFTIDEAEISTGNVETIKSKLKYQYSENGTIWFDCNNALKHQFDTHPENKNYKIRAIYRDIAADNEAIISLESPAQIENGNMESWSAEERGYYFKAAGGSSSPKLRTYYPWSKTSFWNTNNDYTTRYRDAKNAAFSTVYRYNSFPAVSYTKDAHDGTWAAELRNTAAGQNNAVSTFYDYNKVPGELYIGEMSISGNSYTITQGRAFSVRPSSIRFWYKYTPYNTDSWKVYVALYDEQKNLIIESSYTNSEEQDIYTAITIPFNYEANKYYKPCKYIYIYFASSIYKGEELPFKSSMNVTTWYNDSQRTDETPSGSVFKIDDISLIFDK